MRAEGRRQKAVGSRQNAEGRMIEPFGSIGMPPSAFCFLPSADFPAKRGMTLAELLISMTILSMMSVVLAGMSNAVNSAWSYTKGVEETDLQSRAALERIGFMVSQTGAYKVTGQPTRLGMAVVTRTVGSHQLPDTLVLWTGGRSGGMAANGVQSRLPLVGELLIYTWDASAPGHLIEAAFPGQTTVFEFTAADLTTQVTNLLASKTGELIPLCERLRVSSVSDSGTTISLPTLPTVPSSPWGPSLPTMPAPPSSSPSPSSSTELDVGNIRFTLTLTPSDSDLATASPQTTAWTQLNWPQGRFGSRSGMRQANLQMELQVEPDGIVRASDTVSAIPFFGSASVRYVYEP